MNFFTIYIKVFTNLCKVNVNVWLDCTDFIGFKHSYSNSINVAMSTTAGHATIKVVFEFACLHEHLLPCFCFTLFQ